MNMLRILMISDLKHVFFYWGIPDETNTLFRQHRFDFPKILPVGALPGKTPQVDFWFLANIFTGVEAICNFH